jgi:hypothetical protein
MDRAFSPHRWSLTPETQAEGLGRYGVAPSVLGLAATRTSAPQVRCYPAREPKDIRGVLASLLNVCARSPVLPRIFRCRRPR